MHTGPHGHRQNQILGGRMPVYTYLCSNEECRYNFSKVRPMSAAKKPDVCPVCGNMAKWKLSTPSPFVRGPGWHARLVDHDAGKPGRG